ALQDIIVVTTSEVLSDSMECNFGFAFMRTLDEITSSYLTTDIQNVCKGPFQKGEVLTVQIRVNAMPMRVGSFYVLGGVADRSGLLWYETKLSKMITIRPNKGVGPLIMRVNWDVSRG